MARKAQAEQVQQSAGTEAAALHQMLVGVREQMEYMLREQFAQVESAMLERVKERDARIAAAESLIARIQEESTAREAEQRERLAAAESLLARLQEEAATREAEAQRQAERLEKLRQLALEA